jgi:transposase
MQIKLSSPKIWLATQAADFRKSIDGLSEIIHSHFDLNLQESIFIFYNQGKNKIKLLAWHGNGFVLIYKRLERGRFTLQMSEQGLLELDEKQLSWLFAGLDWYSMSHWRELTYENTF